MITSHIQQNESAHANANASGPQQVAGIIVHDSEVLEPDPVRAGGLMRQDVVSTSIPSTHPFFVC